MSDSRAGYRDANDRSGSQRGVRSTRTPIDMDTTRTGQNSKDPESQLSNRSKSVPHSTASAFNDGPKRAMTTMPVPSTTTGSDVRQRTRTTSNPKTQSSANARGGTVPRPPDKPEKKGSSQGPRYIVEDPAPSRSTREAEARGREQEDPPSSYLVPPRRSYNPTSNPDTRQSTSTFLSQTENSSYYSVEENSSSVGAPSMPQPQYHAPAPQMPQPYRRDSINNDSEASSDQDLSPEAQYEKLWNAAQTGAHAPAPPMPVPDITSPSMPAPYLYEGQSPAGNDNAESEGKEGEERKRLEARQQDGGARTTDSRRQRLPSNENRHASIGPADQYTSSQFASSPGMPVAAISSATPAIPSPGPQPQSQHLSSPLASSPNTTVPTITPLRIHHPRPAGTGQAAPSNALSTNPNITPVAPVPPTINPSNLGRPHHQTQNTTADVPKPHDTRPGVGSTMPSNSYSRPTAPGSNQSSLGRTNYVVPNFGPQKLSAVDPRPPGASAPGIPSGASSSVTQAHRPPHSGPAHSQVHNQPQKPPTPTNSAFSSSQAGSRIEHHQPAAPPPGQPASTLYGQTGQGKLPTSILLNNNKPSVPNVPQQQPPKPATSAPTGVTSSASVGPTKPHNAPAISQTQTQSSHSTHSISQASRPQTQTHTEPNKPASSALQMHTSTSSNTHSQPKIEHHSKPAPAPTPSAATAAISSGPTRPHLRGNPSQMDTQYVNMLLALDDIPALHNIAAQFFTWILLAGFILFPGTFTSLQNGNATLPETVRQELLKVVTNLPLFIVAWICTGVGVAGMLWLWWRWRKNYIWALNKIFIPGFLNSLAGLLSTIASVFGAQHGDLSRTSLVTVIVTAASTGVLGFLAGFYSLWLVRRVKARHDREVGKQRAGKYGEGVVDLSKRK